MRKLPETPMRAWLCLLGVVCCSSLAAKEPALLYVSQASGNPEIMLVTGEGEPQNVTNNAAVDAFPAWSPDGKRIAFCSARDGAINVYVMNADGSEVEKISDLPRGSKAACHCPSWSPDGDAIAFQRREGDVSQLVTVELESGRKRILADNAWDPAWSPKGDKIVFTGLGETGWSLFTIEPDGAKRTEIVTSDSKVGYVYPAWSPDGERIAYTGNVGDAYELRACDADGANITQLTKAGRMNTHAVWSPDGKRVGYLHDVDGKTWRWETVDLATGKSEPIKDVAAEVYIHGGRLSWRSGE